MKNITNNSHLGKLIFFIFFLTLFIGFYFNEDGSAGGSTNDFYLTWGYVLSLQKDLFTDSSQWTIHLPLHYIILSRLSFFIKDQNILRLFYCAISALVPLLFYFNLKLKFELLNKNLLWLLVWLLSFIE